MSVTDNNNNYGYICEWDCIPFPQNSNYKTVINSVVLTSKEKNLDIHNMTSIILSWYLQHILTIVINNVGH